MNTSIWGMSTTFIFNIQQTNICSQMLEEKKHEKVEKVNISRAPVEEKFRKNIEKSLEILRFFEVSVSHRGRA